MSPVAVPSAFLGLYATADFETADGAVDACNRLRGFKFIRLAGFSLISGFWTQSFFARSRRATVEDSIGAAAVRHPLAEFTVELPDADTSTVADKSSWLDSTSPVVMHDDRNRVAFCPIFNPPVQYFRRLRVEP